MITPAQAAEQFMKKLDLLEKTRPDLHEKVMKSEMRLVDALAEAEEAWIDAEWAAQWPAEGGCVVRKMQQL